MKKSLLLCLAVLGLISILVGCGNGNKSSNSTNETSQTAETSSSTEKSIHAFGNELHGEWEVNSAGNGPSTSNIDITLTNNSKDSVIVDSSNLTLIYTDKDNGDDTINSSFGKKKTIKPKKSITFQKIFENFGDQRALYGFTVKYGNYSVLNEAAKAEKTSESNVESQPEVTTNSSVNNTNAESSEEPVDNPSPETIAILSEISSTLRNAKESAIANQERVIAEGGSENDVESPVSAVTSAGFMLKMKYPEYSETIDQNVASLGY